ncbi:hypothetical protein NBRC116188_13550 [Oceaniserpentilla sp. 4NH20-0058]|uniref:CotH kinase family protein n=1 Tax=Oceaniserpentilla sp. 4NH20-0058 TaxID=3127660 RepID=UPI003106C954
MKHLLLITLLAMLNACGSGSTEPSDKADFFVPDDLDSVTGDPFDTNRLMVVQIQLPENDFKTLADEGRSLADMYRSCPREDFEYTDFSATVSIDGEELEDVTVRKKGFLGSLSVSKPSFKFNFDDGVEGRRFKGLKRMTLNNNRQDATNVRQCLAYKMYNQAGIKAPRCSLARVYVNGEDLGVYTHVESIKKPFLERVFGNDEGNLYEAQSADFGTHLNQRFQLKTNKTENDRSDLDAVANALDLADDENFLATLDTLVDMDAFYTHWAMDAVLGHWDSAMGNNNNFYIYNNPDNNKFYYIPWGTDAAFTGGDDEFLANIGPLYHNSRITKRLFSIETKRAEYYARINELLAEPWAEQDILDYIDDIQTLTDAPDDAVTALKAFVSGSDPEYAEKLSTNLDEDLPTRLASAMANDAADHADYTLNDVARNCENFEVSTTEITANFTADEGQDSGTFSFDLLNGDSVTANITVIPDDSILYDLNTFGGPTATHAISLVGVDQAQAFAGVPADDIDVYVLHIVVDSENFKEGDTDFHGFSTFAFLFKFSAGSLILMATSADGGITLDNAGDGTNSLLSGSVSGTLGHLK